LDESDKKRVEKEIIILKSLMHKNLIQIYSVIEDPSTIFLIMEYVNGGELFEYICLKQRLIETEACKFYQDIISGIEYLHKQGIVHRDLKPENLLLTNKKEIKIVDFGLSNIYKKGELLKTPCGSPCYAAPEMILGNRYNGLFVDIWSSGIILFSMVFGFLPFDEPCQDILYKKITKGNFNLPKYGSDILKDLLKKILTTDPQKRITLEQIKNHPWFNLIKPKLFQGIYIKKYIIPVNH
jgi:5'-AMP-activated protein kinase catalytic alpha subunit